MIRIFTLNSDGTRREVLDQIIIIQNNDPNYPNDSYEEWYFDGKLHREDDEPAKITSEYKAWYINGELHRENGPAIEHNNGTTKEWWFEGKIHREDGPAVEFINGDKEWWYNDKCIGMSRLKFTQEDFERYLKIKEYW